MAFLALREESEGEYGVLRQQIAFGDPEKPMWVRRLERWW
jgi:hypothetical protein